MLQKLIAKYGLAAHLSFLAAVPIALAPLLDATALAITMMWLVAFAAVWLFMVPVLRGGERYSQARLRIVKSMALDPLFWFLLFAVIFCLCRYLNNGIELSYSVEQGQWMIKRASFEILPASYKDSGFMPLCVSICILVLAMGIKHGLELASRCWFSLSASLITGLGGVIATYQICGLAVNGLTQAAVASMPDGPFLGSLFVPWLFIAISSYSQAEVAKWSWAKLPYVFAIGGNACAIFFFMPSLIGVAIIACAMVFAIWSFVWTSRVASSGAVARLVILMLFGMMIPVILYMLGAPASVKTVKVAQLNPVTLFPPDFFTTNSMLDSVAQKLWKGAPWYGVGLDAFGISSSFAIDPSEWESLPAIIKAPYNGFWAILAERGIIGCAVVGLGLFIMMYTWGARGVAAFKFIHNSDEMDKFVFACPPLVWGTVLVVLLIVGEAYFTNLFGMSIHFISVVSLLLLGAESFPKPSSRSK